MSSDPHSVATQGAPSRHGLRFRSLMEIGQLALRYLPFVAMIAVAGSVLLDARVRTKRPGRAAWAGPTELTVAVLMGLLAVGVVVLSPALGLWEAGAAAPAVTSGAAAGVAAGCYLILATIALGLLLLGLAAPAQPHPRRGLTAGALVLDGALVLAGSGYLLAGVSVSL